MNNINKKDAAVVVNQLNEFGLVEKSQVASNGEHKILNFKLKVDPMFHARWNATFEKLSTRYNGGGAAVMLKTIERLLPQLESLAESIPDISG